MTTYPYPIKETKDCRAASKARPSAILNFLLFFCVLFSLRFVKLLFHEVGHFLPDLINGNVIKILYVHPFTFSGFVGRIYEDTVIKYAAGPVMGVLVPLLIFISVVETPFGGSPPAGHGLPLGGHGSRELLTLKAGTKKSNSSG